MMEKNYFARLKMLLRVAYSRREMPPQINIPISIESAPLSIPPMTPKNAIKRTSESAVFSIFTATEQAKMPIIAQIKEMRPSPYLREGSARSLAIFLPYEVLSKYEFILISIPPHIATQDMIYISVFSYCGKNTLEFCRIFPFVKLLYHQKRNLSIVFYKKVEKISNFGTFL